MFFDGPRKPKVFVAVILFCTLAFRLRETSAGGASFMGLGRLSAGPSGSYAFGVSGDGTVVVGRANSDLGAEAFRWTRVGGMLGLGDLPGGAFDSWAMAVSADGLVVVG
jgi:probable HAF family extracellular repeat protein